jgi:hypothetical protein
MAGPNPENEPFNPSPEEIHEFVGYLKTTLIPDLLMSGYLATAQDFEKCATIITVLMALIEEEGIEAE